MAENTNTVTAENIDDTANDYAKFDDSFIPDVSEDSGDIVSKVLAERMPLYNELVDLVSQHKAATDIDGSISEFVENTDNEEIKALVEKREKARAAEKKLTEQINALATESMQKEIAPDFDADESKRKIQDVTVALRDGADFMRQLFVMSGHLKEDRPEATEKNKRPRAVFTAQDEKGEALLKILNQRPTLSAAGANKGTGEGKIIRAWAESEGLIEKGKVGKLPTEVKEKWEAAGKPGLNS